MHIENLSREKNIPASASNPRIKLTYVILGIMLILSFLTGLVDQSILSMGILLCCVCLLCTDRLVLAFPFIIFYNDWYGLIFGVSMLRIFTVMLLLNVLLHLRLDRKIKLAYFIPIGIYFIFLFTTLSAYDTRRAIFAAVDVIACALMTSDLLDEKGRVKEFFTVFTFVALVSYVTGLICDNSMIEGTIFSFEYSRFMGTFEDPNYMGFFFNIAIFSVMSLKLFKPGLRAVVVVILEVMMLASISITAFVVNLAVWVVYLFVSKKIKLYAVVAIGMVVLLTMNMYSYGLENPDAPIWGPMAYRVEEKLDALERNDMNSVTTGRTNLVKENFEYFQEQPFQNKLLGGTSVNSVYLHANLNGVSHNEYLDMLLNVGYVGTFGLLAFFIWRTISVWKKYRATGSAEDKCILINKCVWAAYTFGLTLFLDYRFLFFFFI